MSVCVGRVSAESWTCECLSARLDWLARHGYADKPAGADSMRYHPATGRDLRNFPPDRRADFTLMDLAIDIPDMNTPAFSAVCDLSFSPVGRPLDTLTLNAEQFQLGEVSMLSAPDGESVTSAYDDRFITLRFNPPIPVGTSATVRINYRVSDPPEGLIWTPESQAWPGRAAQLHTQGQPETNRFWFPCHDFPNERLATRVKLTVPEGYQTISNGSLLDRPVTENGRTTWVWNQGTDHVNYLVMMAVGKWDVQDVGSLEGGTFRVPLPVYAPQGRGADIARTYRRTPDMIRVFEERFGVPYAWDKYAQVCVWNFGSGGMENTSATTLYDTAVLDEKALRDGDLDGLISHELAHQWFGDLITCNTWAHIWLNEGWATYATMLWYEARDGFDGAGNSSSERAAAPPAGGPGYLLSVHGSMRGLAANDQIGPDAPPEERRRPGMVSPVYEHPWETFRRTSNPYPKGASILHMLRMRLGDKVFFDGVRAWVRSRAHTTVETDEFRRTMEHVSGESLEGFFDQWAYRPGTPKVKVAAEWDAEASELKLKVEQQQRIDADLPAFRFRLPVVVQCRGEKQELTIEVDTRRHERRVKLASDPEMVAVDPMLHVLMDLSVEQASRRFVSQLEQGPTTPSRVDAAWALGRNTGNPDAVEALAGCVRNSQEHYAVRAEAAESLGKIGRADVLLDAVRRGEADSKMGAITDARVRLGVIRGLSAASSDEARAALLRVAGDEQESYAVRSAALESLGKTGRPEYLSVIVAALGAESRDDQVRIAALRALGELNVKEAMDHALPFCRPGVPGRTRPVAIEVVGKLSRHEGNQARAYDAVAPLLNDREDRARGAAVAALVEIKDKRGLEALARLAASTRGPQFRERVEEARGQLAAAINADKSVEGVNAELDRLRRELDLLNQKIKQDEDKR